MCLTHFSIARALLALGDWIAAAAELPGLGASFLANRLRSGLVGNRGKASPGTRSGHGGWEMETRMGAPWAAPCARPWPWWRRGPRRRWHSGPDLPFRMATPAVPGAGPAAWASLGASRARPLIRHDSSIRDEMPAKSFSV